MLANIEEYYYNHIYYLFTNLIMKKIINFFGLMTVTLCCLFITTSCTVDNPTPTPTPTEQREHGAAVDPNYPWTYCKVPAYIGNIGALPADLQTVIKKRFTNQVDLASASIAFVDAAAVVAPSDELKAFIDRGGLIAVALPQQTESDMMEGYSNYEGYKTLFYATDTKNRFYTMFDEEEQKNTEEGEDDVQYDEALDAEKKGGHPKEEEIITYYSSDNETAKNLNYWENRVEDFMAWFNESKTETTATDSNDSAEKSPYEWLSADINSTPKYYFDFPISLNKLITKGTLCKADYLNCSSNVKVEFQVLPFYANSSSPNPGDYYIVKGRVVPRNQNMWKPDYWNHGLTQSRIVGYWMEKMVYKFYISDSKGNALSTNDVKVAKGPYPENMTSARQVSNNFNWSLSGGLSGGISAGTQGVDGQGGLEFGFNVNYGTSINYSQKNLDFTTGSYGEAPTYTWTTHNIRLRDFFHDENNEAGWNKYYPKECRSEFNAEFLWVWRAFYGQNGIQDNSTTNLHMTFKIDLTYNSWYHWRCAHQFDNNRKSYDINLKPVTVKMHRPYRTPWGLVKLKNATEHSSIRDITIYKEENGELKKVKTVGNSYEYQQAALTHLDVGTYSLTYKRYDTITGEYMGENMIEDFEVKKGGSAGEATIELSTIGDL